MADVPPWPASIFNCTTFFCPIIIWLLLSTVPPAYANLLDVHYRSRGTLLHNQRQPLTRRHHHPRKKKRDFRQPSPLKHIQLYSKRSFISIFAAAWFFYKLGCNFELFCHRARHTVFGCHGGTCTMHQATALQGVRQANQTTSVKFNSDS